MMQPEQRQLVPGVYMLEVPFPPGWFPPDAPPATLCYLVKMPEGWLMVDCGFNHDYSFDSLCQQLASLRISLKDIRLLLVTHFHPDHFGLAGRIKAATNAKVIMHREDWNMVRFMVQSTEAWSKEQVLQWATSIGVPSSELGGYENLMTFGRMLFPAGLEPDTLIDGAEGPLGEMGFLRTILTPGHTPGHICLYDERNKVLFSGDHVLVGITTHIMPSYLGSENQLGQYLSSLRRVRELDVKMVLPAHERPFDHLDRRVDELLEHHRQRLGQVLVAVGSCPSSPWMIASQVEWVGGAWGQMDAMNRMLAIQETLAHLHLLQHEGRVTVVQESGLSLYRLGHAG